MSNELKKFIDIVYQEKDSLDETTVSGDSLDVDLSALGLKANTSFQKTNFNFDEEKTVLSALDTGERKSSPIIDLFNTPNKELSPGKKKIHKVFTDLYTSIGVWDPKTNNFLPDNQLDSNDLEIKNKINNLSLIKSIIYLAELGEIDERFKGWWRRFLNRYVEKLDKIVSFSIEENSLQQKGLYLWVFDNEIKYVGIASANYTRTLKNEYGGLKGYQCTLNGNLTRCKLNGEVQKALNNGQTVEYWIGPYTDSELSQIYSKNKEVLDNYIQTEGKKSFSQQSLEVIESCLIYLFRTLKPDGINGNYSNTKVGKELNSKGKLELNEVKRFRKLAGIN
jgi:hypothetical protein